MIFALLRRNDSGLVERALLVMDLPIGSRWKSVHTLDKKFFRDLSANIERVSVMVGVGIFKCPQIKVNLGSRLVSIVNRSGGYLGHLPS